MRDCHQGWQQWGANICLMARGPKPYQPLSTKSQKERQRKSREERAVTFDGSWTWAPNWSQPGWAWGAEFSLNLCALSALGSHMGGQGRGHQPGPPNWWAARTEEKDGPSTPPDPYPSLCFRNSNHTYLQIRANQWPAVWPIGRTFSLLGIE